MKIVILAGGSGTRLWPVSRKNNPKQVQPFLDDDTLLQKTYNRLRRGFDSHDIYVSTMEKYLPSVYEQLPQLPKANIISEPCKRDTAAAIGLAATKFYFRNPCEVMVTVHGDHYVDNEENYLQTLKLAIEAAQKYPQRGFLIGVKPSYPETGFGYIKMNSQFVSLRGGKIFNIDKFVEKPDLATAQKYISQWEYLWNPGYFIWRVDTLLAQYKRYLPDTYRVFCDINRALGTAAETAVVSEKFTQINPVAFDYGILERADNLAVIPADFNFTDIGNWRTVKDVLLLDKNDNITKGKTVVLDSFNNLIYNFTNNVVSVAGLKDMIVVAVSDATLICHQDDAQGVKKIVEKLERMGWEEYL